MSDAALIVQKLWSYCHVLRDDGLSYLGYIEQVTYLLLPQDVRKHGYPPDKRQEDGEDSMSPGS